MNTYKAILDTRRPNGVIATITQFDNATLALQIVTNGEIEHPWEAPQFELIAMKRDQQAVRESDQAAFTINDAGEHRVTVDLKEQFLTCRGSVKMQLVVKDGDRLSTSVFYVMVGESLDHGIIESHRDVAVLDELEQYVKTGYDDLAYQEQRMKDVEKVTHELNELMVGNEAERQEAESKRQALFEGNEGQRQDAFNQQLTSQRREFDTSQADREGVFNALKQNLSSEFNAAQNEREREFDRVMASNQTQFNDAETSRASTFSHRQLENERTFTANENARQTLFNANEAGRQTNEAGRVSNENTRKTNEAERVAAEAGRQQKMSEFEAKATQLSDELDAQVARVDAFVSANEEKLLGDRDKVDYMGNSHESVKAASDANVDWLLGEVNTAHYEGQHITATETIEGRAKSAILKGQTLVNLSMQKKSECVITNQFSLTKPNLIRGNKTYILIFTHTGADGDRFAFQEYDDKKGWIINHTVTLASNTPKQYYIFTTKENTNLMKIQNTSTTENNYTLDNLMVLEYQEGMENWDIPYFEGMASVKMPVLTTTGKNLFDINHFSNLENWDRKITTERPYDAYEIKLKPNTSYTFSRKENSKGDSIYFCISQEKGVYDWSGGIVHPTDTTVNCRQKTITTDSTGILYLNLYQAYKELANLIPLLEDAQIEVGTQATTYEPFKSNILTVNEDVELRGIGDVRDTLDCLTGEVVERIGEIVLDGSYTKWTIHNNSNENSTLFISQRLAELSNNSGQIISTTSMSDTMALPKNVSELVKLDGFEGICVEIAFPQVVYLRIKNSKLSSVDSNGLNNYLQTNPVTIQYKLATTTIKTVALSDHHVYSYKDVTHYDCSSAEGSLVPTLSVDVPTNLSALVSRQRATIETLESENQALKLGQADLELGHEHQEEEIISTQDAVNFLLFDALKAASYTVGQKEYDRMAVYIANQIIRGKVSYQLAVSKYPQFVNDIDEILVNEGRGDLIVKID